MDFIVLNRQDKRLDKVAVRKKDICQVIEFDGAVSIVLYNGDAIDVNESFSEIVNNLNETDNR